MANIKSAKKRILVNRTKAERNKAIKSGVKTAVKKVNAAIEAGDKAAASAATTSLVDATCTTAVLQSASSSTGFSTTRSAAFFANSFAIVCVSKRAPAIQIKASPS